METKLLPSCFANLRSTTPSPIGWEELVDEIRSTKHTGTTREYRHVLQRLAACPDGSPQMEALKKQKDKLKGDSPAFIPSVILEGGRSTAHVRGYTGYVMVDIDGIPAEGMAEAASRVKDDPHTFLSYVTLSGRGLRVIARAEPLTDKQQFARAWQAVNGHYARLTGLDTDAQCKNATRMSVICHDPGVLFRPEAAPFVLPADDEGHGRQRKRKRTVKALNAEATVRRMVEEAGVRYEAHHHNDYISRCLYWMNRFGVPCKEAERWALDTFADYEAETHAVASIVRSCYARTEEHATERLAAYRPRREGQASRRASVEEMEQFINGRMQLRMNTLIHQLEFRLADAPPHARWARMTDQAENTLWCDMQRAGINADLQHIRTLLGSDFVEDFHPVRAYLDGLPPWDGKTDFIGQAAARVHCANLAPEAFADYFRRWLAGMLAGALDERVVNHVILVFIGRQGCFKSSFMEHLLPPCLHPYYTSKTNSQRLTKDDLFAMTENLIINFEEIDSMQRSELNQLKAMTTTLHVNERPAYGRNKVRLPHVASFCATGNNLQFLNDDTGTRRWLVAEIDRIDNPWENPLPYEGIFAQAKALLDEGFRYWFDDREIETLHRRNRHFETPNAARELILSYYRKPMEHEKGRYITATQIVMRFGGQVRLNAVQVGRALKELEFTQVRTRTANYWVMVERSAEEINAILPEPHLPRQPAD